MVNNVDGNIDANGQERWTAENAHAEHDQRSEGFAKLLLRYGHSFQNLKTNCK
jgi:hypothetical protein